MLNTPSVQLKSEFPARGSASPRAATELNPQTGVPARHAGGSKLGKARSSRISELRHQVNYNDTLPSQMALPAGRLSVNGGQLPECQFNANAKVEDEGPVRERSELKGVDAAFSRCPASPLVGEDWPVPKGDGVRTGNLCQGSQCLMLGSNEDDEVKGPAHDRLAIGGGKAAHSRCSASSFVGEDRPVPKGDGVHTDNLCLGSQSPMLDSDEDLDEDGGSSETKAGSPNPKPHTEASRLAATRRQAMCAPGKIITKEELENSELLDLFHESLEQSTDHVNSSTILAHNKASAEDNSGGEMRAKVEDLLSEGTLLRLREGVESVKNAVNS